MTLACGLAETETAMDRSLLAQSQIFKDLTDDEAESVGEICEIIELKAGEFIFREGDDGDRLYIIESGEVRISRTIPGAGEEALTVLRRGACSARCRCSISRAARRTRSYTHGAG
jgi:hypothetical protein